jgi:Bax protein
MPQRSETDEEYFLGAAGWIGALKARCRLWPETFRRTAVATAGRARKPLLIAAAACVPAAAGGVLVVAMLSAKPEPAPPEAGPSSYRGLGKLASYRMALTYDLRAIRQGHSAVPRVYLATLPEALSHTKEIAEHKVLFMRVLLPLVLAANEDLRQRRREVQELLAELQGGAELPAEKKARLAWFIDRYGARDAADLLSRVDEIPPSLAMAQAILESGWGRSRFSRSGNALYGQREWNKEGSGLVPEDLGSEASFRVRAFDDLLSGVKAYMHNLNSHQAYARLRATRAQLRALRLPLRGLAMVEDLGNYTNENRNYARTLRQIIVENRLTDFDPVALVRLKDS